MKNLCSYLSNNLGFSANPYDSWVMKKEINGKQFTIGWHVDNLKLSHVDKKVVENIISKISYGFGKEAPLTVTCGNIHDYLGMKIDFTKEEQVQFLMLEYIDQIVDETPKELLKGPSITPAANHLFNLNSKGTKLHNATSILYHYLAAQLLYLGKRTRPDIHLTVSFLCTRVQAPNKDNWKKFGRCIGFLRETCNDLLTLSVNGTTLIICWIHASFAVHDYLNKTKN